MITRIDALITGAKKNEQLENFLQLLKDEKLILGFEEDENGVWVLTSNDYDEGIIANATVSLVLVTFMFLGGKNEFAQQVCSLIGGRTKWKVIFVETSRRIARL